MKLRYIINLGALMFFIGCGGQPKAIEYTQAEISKPKNYKKVQAGFKDSLNVYNAHSRWFDRSEALELNIIGPVYKDPLEKQSQAYKKLAVLLKKIAKDPKLLDRLSKQDLSSRYSKINYIPFKLGSDEDAKFSAVYAQRLDAKEGLNAVLQELSAEGKDKINQTLAIWINPNDLKNGIYTLEGYKTVKTATKQRNSAYFQLSKQTSDTQENQEIINALLATLALSIPEYVAIDRKDMLKQGDTFRIITDNLDGTAMGKVYKFDLENEVDKLKRQKTQTTQRKKLQDLDKQIKEILASKAWVEYQTKQLLYTSPLSQKDINILKKYDYVKTTNPFNKLSAKDAREISKALNYSLPDPFLMIHFEQYQHLINELALSVGRISKLGDAYYFMGLNKMEYVDDKHESGTVALMQAIIPFYGLYKISSFNDELEKSNESIKEGTQSEMFFATSLHDNKKTGLKEVHQSNLKQLGKEVKFIKPESEFVYGLEKNKLVYYEYLVDKLTLCNLDKEISCISKKLGLKHSNNFSIAISTGKQSMYIGLSDQNTRSSTESVQRLKVYDINTLDLLKTVNLSQSFNNILAIKESPNGKRLAVSTSSEIHMIDTSSWKKLSSHYAKSGGIVFAKDSKHIASCTGQEESKAVMPDGYCEVYKTDDLRVVASLIAPPESQLRILWRAISNIHPICFDEKSEKLIALAGLGYTYELDYKNNKSKLHEAVSEKGLLYSDLSIKAVSEDNKYYVVADSATMFGSSRIHIYDKQKKQIYTLPIEEKGLSLLNVNRIQISGENRYLLIPARGGLRIYEWESLLNVIYKTY